MATVPYEGDLALGDDGDLDVVDDDLALALGNDSIQSDVSADLSLWKGEWFLDLDEGFPYLDEVFVKNPDLPGIRDIARGKILACAGVQSVEEITIALDKRTREAALAFRALDNEDLLIADQVQTSPEE